MGALLDVTLPVFLVLGIGYLAVRVGVFSADGIDGLMKFAQTFAFPCLLFRAISQLDLGEHFDWPLLVSYYTGSFTGFGLGFFGAMVLFRRPVQDAIAIGFTAMFANSVMLGLPITERAYGTEALGSNYAIVALHAPICFMLGITAMEIARNKGVGFIVGVTSVVRSMATNALMIGIGLGFVVNLFGIVVPQILASSLDLIVRAALPVALFALGGVLVRHRPEGDLVQVAFICAISLIIHPAIVWLMSTRVTDLPTGAMQSAMLTAAMAPGINSYIFANMYGVAKRVAASAVLIGTISSIFTVSAWLAFLG